MIERFLFFFGGHEFHHGHDTLHTGHLVATKMHGVVSQGVCVCVFFFGVLQLPASSIPDLLITRIEVTFHP